MGRLSKWPFRSQCQSAGCSSGPWATGDNYSIEHLPTVQATARFSVRFGSSRLSNHLQSSSAVDSAHTETSCRPTTRSQSTTCIPARPL